MEYLQGKSGPIKNKRLQRWITKFGSYDKEIIYKPGSKNTNADGLSRMFCIQALRPYPYNKEVDELISQEDIRLVANVMAEANLNAANNEWNVEEISQELPVNAVNEEVTKEDKWEIIKEFHENKLYGHRGWKTTAKKIRHHGLEWKTLSQDVRNFVKSCKECCRNKSCKNPRQPLVLTEIPSNPLEIAYMDIVGPLPVTESGFKYLLTYMDGFSKYIHMNE